MAQNYNIKNSLKESLIRSNHFFCISHFDGDLSWVKYIKKNNYIIYNKSEKRLSNKFTSNKIKNYGYNLYSSLLYKIDNYENLPKTMFFQR